MYCAPRSWGNVEVSAAPGELGEFDLIARYFAPLATAPGALGLKDDAALFDIPEGHTGIVTTDAMVAGVHFFESDDPSAVGWKLLAVNLSDLAAKGAEPLGYTLDFALPRDWPAEKKASWTAGFARGLSACQSQFQTSLLGGDTVSMPGPVTLAITAFGAVPKGKAIRRSGAQVGDNIWVSGTIGDAALAVKIRQGWTPPPGLSTAAANERLDRPTPRLALGRALRSLATAAADISDGLAADLGHICDTSRVGAEIRFADVPLGAAIRACLVSDGALIATALAGGDDYELVFTVPPELDEKVRAAAALAQCPINKVGRIVSGGVVRIAGPDGKPIALDRLGFTHF
jgi:thiamine-monophosphate kinase